VTAKELDAEALMNYAETERKSESLVIFQGRVCSVERFLTAILVGSKGLQSSRCDEMVFCPCCVKLGGSR
jgi:hypothetical protein